MSSGAFVLLLLAASVALADGHFPPPPVPVPPGPPRPGPAPGPPFPPGPHPSPADRPMICKEEFIRFCAFRVDDMRNMEEIVECLDRHIDQLSPPCKNATAFAAEFIEEFHDGCDANMQDFCPEMISTPEQGRCILEHLPDLHKPCLAMVQKALYIMIRLHKEHGKPGPPPRDLDFGLPTTNMFFPGLVDEVPGMDGAAAEGWDPSLFPPPHMMPPPPHMMPPPDKMMFHAAFCGSIAGIFAVALVLLFGKCVCHRRRRCAAGRSACCQQPAPAQAAGAPVLDGYKEFA